MPRNTRTARFSRIKGVAVMAFFFGCDSIYLQTLRQGRQYGQS